MRIKPLHKGLSYPNNIKLSNANEIIFMSNEVFLLDFIMCFLFTKRGERAASQ